MYFCPECSYVLDIGKTNKDGGDKEILEDVDDVIKEYKKGNIAKFNINITNNELKDYSKFKKMKKKEQKDLEKLLDNNKESSGVFFQCNNCNYSENINNSILIYKVKINHKVSSENTIKKDINQISSKNKTVEDYKLIAMNPILPRTRDYNCKNLKCITHTNKVKKEAVFYKNPETYDIHYVCTVCYNPWKV